MAAVSQFGLHHHTTAPSRLRAEIIPTLGTGSGERPGFIASGLRSQGRVPWLSPLIPLPHIICHHSSQLPETDVLMVVMGVILVLAVMMFGILFFRLHTLPERMAHKSKKIPVRDCCRFRPNCALHAHAHFLDSWFAACNYRTS